MIMFNWLTSILNPLKDVYNQTASENHWPALWEYQAFPTEEIQARIKENKRILREVRKYKQDYPASSLKAINKLEKAITKSNTVMGRIIKDRIVEGE